MKNVNHRLDGLMDYADFGLRRFWITRILDYEDFGLRGFAVTRIADWSDLGIGFGDQKGQPF